MLDHATIVSRANSLPMLSPSCARLAALVARESPEIAEITDVVTFDPVLTAKLLQAANSASSASHRSIATVREAVLRLGASSVFGVAVSASAGPILKQPVAGYGISAQDIWRHCAAAALAAELVRKRSRTPISPLAFTAALLHDMGKLVLGPYLTPELIALCSRAVLEGNLLPHEAEMAILSMHHGEVGGVIAQHWNLPESMVAGITHHHTPEESDDPICAVTHLANAAAHYLAEAYAPTLREQHALDAARDRLAIGRREFEQLCVETACSLQEVSDRFS